MEDNLKETERRLDFEIDRGEDDIERELRRASKIKNKSGRKTQNGEGFELFGPPAESEVETDLESGSCDFNLGSAITITERSRHETTPKSAEYGKTKDSSEKKLKNNKNAPTKEGASEELSEEEQERHALLVQRIRQIMASRSGRLRGEDLRRMLGGSGMSFDDAVREVVKSYGRALSDDEEGNKDNAEKKNMGLSPVFEAYAGGGSGGGKSPYAMRERELHSDVYAQTGTADVSPEKALKKMRGPYAEESTCDSCNKNKQGPYK